MEHVSRPLGPLLLACALLTACSAAGTTPTASTSGGLASLGPSASAGLVSFEPSGSSVPSPTATSAPTSSVASPAPSIGPRPTFPVGLLIKTISDAVRVRSKPEVSDASVRYEPTLPIATELHILAGPVAGSGLWWYRVELPTPVTLYHGIREGWIAAGARDGTAWIDPVTDVDCYDSCPPSWPPPVTGWPTAKRGDLAMTGEDPVAADGNPEYRVTMKGLLPGSTLHLRAVGTYEARWVCGEPPVPGASEGPLGWGFENLPSTKGTAEATASGTVDANGTVILTLRLAPRLPTAACPSGHDGPSGWGQEWDGVRISDTIHDLVLTPPKWWHDIIL